MYLGVELLAATAEREFQLVEWHCAGEILLAVLNLVHPHSVHCDEFVALLDVDPVPVGGGVRKDSGDLIR